MPQQIELELLDEFEESLKEVSHFQNNNPTILNKNKSPALDAFFNLFLSEEFPKGSLNEILEKNFALYIHQNKLDIGSISSKYKTMGWTPKPLMGWIKKVQQGDIKDFNLLELLAWANKYGEKYIPLLEKAKNELSQTDNSLTILSDSELSNYIPKQSSWTIKNLIRRGSVNVLGGKRSTNKSWLSLALGYAVSSGKKFLDTFDIEQGNVLYADRENGFDELKKRSMMVKEGLDIHSDLPIWFMSESAIKLDSPSDVAKFEAFIREKCISLVIVDTYRRFISFEENDANEVSKFFVDTLKPLCERTGASFIFIHHERKGESQGDDMDMLRGSSDLPNYVDSILQLERGKGSIIIKQTKLRGGKELEPFSVKIESDEINYFKFSYQGVKQDKEVYLAKVIVSWLLEKKLKQVRFTDIKKYLAEKGYNTSKVSDAISHLETTGILQKGQNFKSPYSVCKDLESVFYD